MAGLSLRDRARSADIWKKLRVEPLLLPRQNEPVKVVWPRSGCLLGTFLWRISGGYLTGKRPQSRSRTCWRDYISHLAWDYSGRDGKCCWEEEHLDYLATVTRPRINSQKRMDGWRCNSFWDWTKTVMLCKKTKKMYWKMLKCSVELRGTVESAANSLYV